LLLFNDTLGDITLTITMHISLSLTEKDVGVTVMKIRREMLRKTTKHQGQSDCWSGY